MGYLDAVGSVFALASSCSARLSRPCLSAAFGVFGGSSAVGAAVGSTLPMGSSVQMLTRPTVLMLACRFAIHSSCSFCSFSLQHNKPLASSQQVGLCVQLVAPRQTTLLELDQSDQIVKCRPPCTSHSQPTMLLAPFSLLPPRPKDQQDAGNLQQASE